MTRYLISILLTLCLGLPAWAQTPIRENQVPPAVREDFVQRFQMAENVAWLQEGGSYYGARFSLGGHEGEAVYLPDGQWVQNSEEIAYRDLPDAARDQCRATYSDYSAHEVKQLTTRKYGVLYKLRLRRELHQVTMTFDMHGKLVEQSEEDLEPEKKGGIRGILRR